MPNTKRPPPPSGSAGPSAAHRSVAPRPRSRQGATPGATLAESARRLCDRGWTAVALGPDAKGLPKRPLVGGWQRIPHDLDRILAQPWGRAKGLGILLGPVSGNLAVIDVDHEAMARAVFALMVRGHVYTRMCWTISRHIHVYVREREPSAPAVRRVRWQGEEIAIELKARGQQVAAPPTPGYTLCGRHGWPPIEVPSVMAAWLSIERRLGAEPVTRGGSADPFPGAWAASVPVGQRNRTAFVEACRLREAGMPFAQAVEVMRARWLTAYAGGEAPGPDLDRTVRSAYQRGASPRPRIWRDRRGHVRASDFSVVVQE